MALDFTTSIIKLNNQYTIVGTANDIEATEYLKKENFIFYQKLMGKGLVK